VPIQDRRKHDVLLKPLFPKEKVKASQLSPVRKRHLGRLLILSQLSAGGHRQLGRFHVQAALTLIFRRLASSESAAIVALTASLRAFSSAARCAKTE
jgi:hypothetical protein